MIKEFVDKWYKNKDNLEEYFRNTRQEEYDNYKVIVTKLIELVLNYEETDSFEKLDVERMVQIDNGDYQGTLIYVIPKTFYQPDINEHVYTYVYYGSCSVCDVLQSISNISGNYEGKPSQKQVEGYMQLALNILQHFEYFKEYEE
jgi:hypothetical protein